jgi:integrase
MRVEWLDFEGRAIRIPASEMKSRIAFTCPMNAAAVEHIKAALEAGKIWHPGDHGWVFPSRAPDGARIIATATIREKSWPAHYQGHANRHDFSNVCTLIGIDSETRQLLLAQKIGAGVASVYISPDALFARLLDASERVASKILDLTRTKA